MTAENVFLNIPLWAFFSLTIVVSLLAVETGFRLGRYHSEKHKDQPAQSGPSGAMVTATLALLAFMLAFTFGMASSRFDARRLLVLEESNAVATTFLRAQLLPQPRAAEIQALLREYVDIRVAATTEPGKVVTALARSEELHRLLWLHAQALAQEHPAPMAAVILIQSLNDVISLHSKRVTAGLRSHIPVIIWFTLYFLAIMAMIGMGYQAGSATARRAVVSLFLALAFSSVIALIADLDRGKEGLLRVSQQSMVDLQQRLNDGKP